MRENSATVTTIEPPDETDPLDTLAPTPSPTNSYYADQWNPWQTLAEDYRDYVVTSEHRLPKGTMGLSLGKRIWLSSELNPLEKTCTLAHELVHIELRIFNGHPSCPGPEYTEGERTVCEVTARRMVPFRDLSRVVGARPDALVRTWAWMLRVDAPTLADRLRCLSATERAALAAVRGGPLPAMPHCELFDGVPDVRQHEPLGAVARLT